MAVKVQLLSDFSVHTAVKMLIALMLHVYCMPGLAANPTIFEKIVLPDEKFKIHWLDWVLPLPKETLKDYARRMSEHVNHENVVLIGVSFGGVLVQEMAVFLSVYRIIIISSVKDQNELPARFKYAKSTGFYKIIPTSLAGKVTVLEKLAVGHFARVRAKLYKKYMSITNPVYLDWAIEKMVCWDQKEPLKNIVHIHGDKDLIFPIQNIKNCIIVPEGTHIMIIMRYKWFNENLEEIILTGKLTKKNKN